MKKTLKRIGLLFKLKWQESKDCLIPLSIMISLFCLIGWGFSNEIEWFIISTLVFLGVVVLVIVIGGSWLFIKWIITNWREVKRRIP